MRINLWNHWGGTTGSQRPGKWGGQLGLGGEHPLSRAAVGSGHVATVRSREEADALPRIFVLFFVGKFYYIFWRTFWRYPYQLGTMWSPVGQRINHGESPNIIIREARVPCPLRSSRLLRPLFGNVHVRRGQPLKLRIYRIFDLGTASDYLLFHFTLTRIVS